jgi:hypothetical protein
MGVVMSFPSLDYRQPTIRITLLADTADYDRLRTQGDLTDLKQSMMIHHLLEMARLRLAVARGQGDLIVDQFPTDHEAWLWLVAQDCGLVTEEERRHAAWQASTSIEGAKLKGYRQEWLQNMLQQRFADRWPGDVSDIVLDEQPGERVLE